MHWAHRVAPLFPDGQLYLNLRGYDPDRPVSPAEALEYFLRELGLDGAAVPQEDSARAARYRSMVAGRKLLILLDNAESVVQVRDLLPGEQSCVVLVTSRDALPALVARHGARRISLDLLSRADAVALLRALIGSRVQTEPAAARALAERAACLPLALRIVAELASSRPADTLADLVSEFDDEAERLDLLSAGEDRYTAVRAVFSWSQQQLSADERRAFALFSLHPGPDLDEVASAALLGVERREARRHFDGLARAHLVDIRRRGRLSMHDLLRAYSAELARELPESERQEALTRLFDHYLTAASGVEHTDAGRAWLDTERANLLAVAAAAGHVWPAHTVGFATTLARYLDAHAYYSDALALDEQALTAARAGGDRSGEATALSLLGNVHRQLAHYGQAEVLHEQGLEIHRELGDRQGEADALLGLGIVLGRAGRYRQARARLEQALTAFREIEDLVGEGHALYALGIAELKLGQYAESVEHQQQAVHLNGQTGERVAEGRSLNNLGEVYLRLGRLDDAAEAYSSALAIARDVGNRAGEGVALSNIATIEHLRGRYGEALAGCRQALVIARELGYRVGEADALRGLGSARSALGEHEDGIAYIAQALTISRSIGGMDAETGALIALGDVLRAAGSEAESIASYRDALALCAQTGDRYEQARAHLGLAAALGDTSEAHEHQRAAQADFKALGLPVPMSH
ncbi:MAG: hypothetical protein DLM58_11840 [Pseudonocardiales bacterium]|nr:MAG: hypothetical protein DLM58_11840 [Pseudonocardiales bacterium]